MTAGANPSPKTCQRCGAAFGCGASALGSGGACWCMDEPYRMPMPPKESGPDESEFTDCLCQACLREVAEAAGLSRQPGGP